MFTATDDYRAEGTPHAGGIAFSVSSADPIYDPMTLAPITVDIVDNDIASVTATPAGPLAIAEGGATASSTSCSRASRRIPSPSI